MGYSDAQDKCDFDDLANEWHFWYRVSGNAGNALAALDTPSNTACGTHVQVYLAESHPIPSDGQVTRKVCSRTAQSNCNNEDNIDVINCGAFYLYKLIVFRSNCSPSNWRYCTNGEAGE